MSAPKYYTQPGAADVQRPVSNSSYQRPPSTASSQQSMGPQYYTAGPPRPPSTSSSQRPYSGGSYNYGLHPKDVDLNMSQLSVGSGASASTMRLGGIDYQVGDRIGSSGLFIIGQPEGPHHNSQTGLSASQPSMATSQRSLIHKPMGYVRRGYSFENWNWGVIRFSLFAVVIAFMIALLAVTIGLSIQQTEKCTTRFLWWQGSVVYHIPVGLFYDYNTDGYGDLEGLSFGMGYVKSLGAEVVLLSHILPASIPSWDLTIDYQGVDPRLGTPESLAKVLKEIGNSGVHVLLELDLTYTSVRHQWFVDSARSSVGIGAKFENFYIWRFDADPKVTGGSWQYNPVRNQYYLHYNDSNKPIVNWTNPLVYEEMGRDMESWLQMGVHGFVLSDLSKMFIDSDNTAHRILKYWREILDDYSTEEHKVLALNDHYLTGLKSRNQYLYDETLDMVDLLRVPLNFDPENRTSGLEGAVASGLEWQKQVGHPWVMWTLPNLSKMDVNYVSALQTFMMTLPGTPSMVAGQEIGKYLLEVKEPEPMLWSPTNTPYFPGSSLGETNIKAMGAMIKAHGTEYSLRRDNLDIDSNIKQFNYKFLSIDEETMLIERNFGRSDAFYYLANFGKSLAERDWSSFSPSGKVVANTLEGGEQDRLQLKEVELEPGQAVVLMIRK